MRHTTLEFTDLHIIEECNFRLDGGMRALSALEA